MSARLQLLAALAVAGCVGRPATAPVVLSDQGAIHAASCAGREAVVRGDANTVTLTDQCRSLRLEGDRNVVFVDLARGGMVRVTGDYNHVVYTPPGPPPVATLLGYWNEVAPGPQSLVPGALVLNGQQGRRDVACDGRDVVIRESQARYVLRGGCRSLAVEGRDDTIGAELMPGARLSIGGSNVVVNYVLTAQGPPPVVRVAAPGNRATHLVRYGDSAFVLPSSVTPLR